MKLAIMQPYFLPYIGYFQLMNAVDKFVVYDNIQYTKKGWINRNRYLANRKENYFTIPLKKTSGYLDIIERELVSDSQKLNKKQLRKFENAYRKAPYFNEVMPFVSECFLYENDNLFKFLLNSLQKTKNFIGIDTEIIISSQIEKDETILKGAERVKNICKLLSADEYYNPIGGIELYNKKEFEKNGFRLNFLKTNSFKYDQFANDFVPFLSILDVLMFNSISTIKNILSKEYELL